MLHLNYLTDASGNQVAVQIAMEEWLAFQQEFQELKRKLEIMQGIRDALEEVQSARKEGRKLQSLSEFLNEC
jgi:predicted component of type VI protein secretion system